MALQLTLLDGRRHDCASFACGIPALDHYLQRQASQHQRDGIATAHVLVDDNHPDRILGYCSLAAAQLLLQDLQPEDRKRLPAYPVPAVRVGRLAVAKAEHGKGHGRLLVGHAVNCALVLRQTLGVRVLLVDAKDERVVPFYTSLGFRLTSADARVLYLPLGRA